MDHFTLNWPIILHILIMLVAGSFGGYLNYLHKFDTVANEDKNDRIKQKYILLGIGASFLVPNFLEMISSQLFRSADEYDYFIFGGFCLISAIFSRRFITTIGEKILEKAKNAEKIAQESKDSLKTTELEVSNNTERIKDIRLAFDLKNNETQPSDEQKDSAINKLTNLANSYIKDTSIPNYRQRLNMKAEIGRKMGEIIIRNKLSKQELLSNNNSEGMLMGIAYAIQLLPDRDSLDVLINISKYARQLYTRYTILVALDTLARNNYVDEQAGPRVYEVIESFKVNADEPLLMKIKESLEIIKVALVYSNTN